VTHASPWATYHAASKAARSDATAIVAPARAARDIALAEAARDLEIARIEARIALDVALTEAEVADSLASAAAAVDGVEAEQEVLDVLAIAAGARGILQARAARGEDQPDNTPPELAGETGTGTFSRAAWVKRARSLTVPCCCHVKERFPSVWHQRMQLWRVAD